MSIESGKERIDFASKVIMAPPRAIYRAYMDPDSLASWLPPRGMTCRIDMFEPREGGGYRMILTHRQPNHSTAGKSSDHSDIVKGRFLELIPDERIVQSVEFESDDPAFAGEMKMTWSLTAVTGGTEVAIRCEHVPEGIRADDHAAGLRSTLENLSKFLGSGVAK